MSWGVLGRPGVLRLTAIRRDPRLNYPDSIVDGVGADMNISICTHQNYINLLSDIYLSDGVKKMRTFTFYMLSLLAKIAGSSKILFFTIRDAWG